MEVSSTLKLPLFLSLLFLTLSSNKLDFVYISRELLNFLPRCTFKNKYRNFCFVTTWKRKKGKTLLDEIKENDVSIKNESKNNSNQTYYTGMNDMTFL